MGMVIRNMITTEFAPSIRAASFISLLTFFKEAIQRTIPPPKPHNVVKISVGSELDAASKN